MASPQTEFKIAQLIKTTIDGEKQLEAYRQVLSEQPQFDPFETFCHLDKECIGAITPFSLCSFLKKHSIELVENDILNLFSTYDPTGGAQISFSSFLNIILPHTSMPLRQLSTFKKPYQAPKKKKLTKMNFETEWALARVIDQEMNFIRRIEILKEDLSRRGDLVLPVIFSSIDVANNGYLDIDSLYIFQKKSRIPVSENDVVVLLRAMDQDNDGKLSYAEFARLILSVRGRAGRGASKARASPSPNQKKVSSATKTQKSPIKRTTTPMRYKSKPIKDIFPHMAKASNAIKMNKSFTGSRAESRKTSISQERSSVSISQPSERRTPINYRRQSIQKIEKMMSQPDSRASMISPDTVNHRRSMVSPDTVNHRGSMVSPDTVNHRGSWVSPDTVNHRGSMGSMVSPDTVNHRVHTLGDDSKLMVSIPQRKEMKTLPNEGTTPSIFSGATVISRDIINLSPIKKSQDFNQRRVSRDTLPIWQTTESDQATLRSIPERQWRLDDGSTERLNEEEEHARELAMILKEQIDLDRDVENNKNELALQIDFNLMDTFKLFDLQGQGYVSRYELEDGLEAIQVAPSPNDAEILMEKFDQDQDGYLRYSDFCSMMMPRQYEYAEILNNRIPTKKRVVDPRKMLSRDTMFLLKQLFESIIKNETYSEVLRQRLNSKSRFSSYKAFKAIDKNRNGFIGIEDFKELLNENGFYACQKELLGLMNRFDKNQDGRISYNEFVEEIRPAMSGKSM